MKGDGEISDEDGGMGLCDAAGVPASIAAAVSLRGAQKNVVTEERGVKGYF